MSVQQWFGTYQATVYSNWDPQNAARVQLRIPQVLGNAVSQWALPISPGVQSPPPGTKVTAVFIGGDPSHPAYFAPLTNPTFTQSVGVNGTLYANALNVSGNSNDTPGFTVDNTAHLKIADATGTYYTEGLPEYAGMLFKNTNGGPQDYAIIAGVAGTDSYWGHNDSFGVGYTGRVTAWQPGTAYPNLAPESWHSVGTGFPTGWGGNLSWTMLSESAQLVFLDFAMYMAASTVITNGELIYTLPSPYFYTGDNKYIGVWYFPNGGVGTQIPINIGSTGKVEWVGAGVTTPSGGTSYFYGQGIFTTAGS